MFGYAGMPGLLCLVALACGTGCDPRVQVVTEAPQEPALAGSRYAARILATPGLRAYFRFSETAGQVVTDRVEGRRLEVEPGVALNQVDIPFRDPEAASVRFFGSATDHLVGAYDAGLHFRRAMSLELWARLHGTASSSGACLQNPEGWTKLVWVDGLEPGWFGAWGLHLFEQDLTAVAFHFQVDPVGDGAELMQAEAIAPGSLESGDDPDCADGPWHHIVVTYDADTEPNAFIYVDGTLALPNGEEHPLIAPAADPGGGIGGYALEPRLHVGGLGADPQYPYAVPADDGLTFDGWLDELALYDRALTSHEVLEHYTIARETSM